MTLLSAGYLWLLVPVLGAIVLLYLLKIRGEDIQVPAVFLWPKLTSDVRANAPFQKLRISLLFVLQIVAAILIIIALAAPQHRVRGLAGETTVIVLDNSASMGATDVYPSRFARAVQRVKDLVNSLSASDRLALIDAGADTKIVFPLSNDRASMVRALGPLQSEDAPANIGEALRLAAALCAGRARSRILVLSDGGFPAITDFSPGGAQLTYEPIGTSYKNVGITEFDSSLMPNSNLQCFASVHNYDDSPMSSLVALTVDNEIADARQVTIPAGSSLPEVFNVPGSARVAHLSVTAPGDILKADDTATIFLKGVGTTRVLLVSAGDLFLERALSLDPAVILERSGDVPEYERAGTPGPGRYDVVVFDNTQPVPVKATAVMSFGAPARELGVADAGIAANPRVSDWQRDSPVMQFADFHDLEISHAHRVSLLPGYGAKALVDGSDGPLVVSAQAGGRRSLYTSWSILDSDFPLRVVFPIFVANSVAWLTMGTGRTANEAGGIMARPGQAFTVAVPGLEATLVCPDGHREPLVVANGAATIRSAVHVGEYRVVGPQVNTAISVNLLDQDAGDVRPKAQLDLAGVRLAASPSPGLMLSDVWRPIVLAALLILATEWWVFVRRS